MKRLIFGMWLAMIFVCDGVAADAVRPRVADLDWTGPFIGANFSYSSGSSKFSSNNPETTGSFGLFAALDPFKGTGSYAIGLSAGYNYMMPSRMVLGVEADVSFPNTIAGSVALAHAPSTFNEAVLASGSLRARLGYAPGAWLIYATGGLAWTYDRSMLLSESHDLTRLGLAWGAGTEYGLSPNWSARFEYLGTVFGSQGVTFSGGAHRVSSDWTLHTARLGFNYRLGRDDRQVLNEGLKPLETDWFSLRAQTTYVQQYAAPFRAPYRGTNSLSPNQTRETWDVTFYAGVRPWQGGEFWINPEIDQGFGLSSTLGVAGFPSGEAYKVGSASPYARIPRAFFRQTFDLGGETKKVDGDINQFAGTQKNDRIVVTVGKFAVTDVFDTNKYAHDPRKDFMNWSLIDTGTFDYAADAWGYTYGAAIEWYQGSWTMRGGFFDLSRVPNSSELDPRFEQFQWVAEIEHRHEIWGLPGKIAVTGFLSRGRMGRFDDAVAQAQATGGPADTASVRSYRSRAGVSVNLEQAVSNDLGIFVRAGVADGSVESYEFTDIDRTAAAGLSLAGASWNRPNDTFGLAGVINGISTSRRAYLDAGGLGILVGDGRLPNSGAEKIVESYYSFPISVWRATLNYQLITNPAYNRDRGPVSVFGTRLRAQL